MITLLTSPKNPTLEYDLVENLRSAWGGGGIKWLSPDEAAEFSVPGRPPQFWEQWENLQELGVDLIAQPGENRKKQMLLADMDSTMIQQECIDELAAGAGVGYRVAGITAQAMNGEIGFEDALRERVALLKGLNTTIIETILAKQITLMPGGPALVATMKSNGAYTVLVSGGFTDFAAKIAAEIGFDEYHANRLLAENGVLSGQVAEPILGRNAKVLELKRITTRLGLNHDQVMAVGDGANDLGMLQLAGTGVALHAKPSVAAQSDIRIDHGDLTALLFIQGYSSQDFVI